MKNTTRLIFIDDETQMEPVYRYIFENEIQSHSIDFHFFDNPKKSLSYILEHKNDKEKTIVVTDYKMPEMNGLEFLTKIKKELPQIDVYMTSGYLKVDASQDPVTMGAVSYIQKPFDIDTFKSMILD